VGDSVRAEITPVAKPRMTQRDVWKKRPCVVRYHQYKDEMRAAFQSLDGDRLQMRFGVPMPKSWSKKKRREMNGSPHRAKPDIDNLIKAVLDALLAEDSHVYEIVAVKRWSEFGSIEILPLEDDA